MSEPIVMGIMNITPDSFYAGSRVSQTSNVIEKATKMIAEGAVIIDVGGQSTRPGSKHLSAEEELQRVLPAIEAIRSVSNEVFISIDTFYAQIAKQCVLAGADMVNDISSGNMDAEMIATVARLKVPYISMHMQGTPQTMQINPQYNNLVADLLDYFIKKLESYKLAGIKDVIIDPGFGFGKTIPQNFELLKKFSAFKILGKPLLAGLSRKGTIYKTLGITAEEALNGTTALNTIALLNGAHILRVHDVKEAMEAIKLVQQLSLAG
ncbi:MAG: dihydropteroate synthase [Chitinophagaceae bacterium]|nr:dihydropteroate synthase [Chitinophagaceae bacterium]